MKNMKKKLLVLGMVVAMLVAQATTALAWPDDGDPPTDPTGAPRITTTGR